LFHRLRVDGHDRALLRYPVTCVQARCQAL
jgi:hypothetical protein